MLLHLHEPMEFHNGDGKMNTILWRLHLECSSTVFYTALCISLLTYFKQYQTTLGSEYKLVLGVTVN